MEKEIVEVDMAMLNKMLEEATKEYILSTNDPGEWEYWRGYRAALYAILESIEGKKDE